MLADKKVLLIVPKYFGYEKVIKDQIEKMGATVFVIFENLDNFSYKYRFIKNYIPFVFKKSVHNYFIRELDTFPSDIDHVLVIRGEFINGNILSYMKSKFGSNCKFSMYQWDSVNNNANAIEIARYFGKISTFDKEDAIKYRWNYRPLFYINEFIKGEKICKNDILFIGSLHSNRIEILNFLQKYCEVKSYKFESHIYTKRLVYLKRKYLNRRPGYISAKDTDVSFNSLSLQECYDKYNNSKVVVDYTHPGQSGYTMRTIECLGSECKLITNNKQVLDADFFDSNNIFVYDGTSFEIDDNFFVTDYKKTSDEVKNKYSLESWLFDIL